MLLWACGQRRRCCPSEAPCPHAPCSGVAGTLGPGPAQAFASEIEPICVVDEAIEHGIGIGGVTDGAMPLVHGELACNDGGSTTVAIFEDLQQIVAGGGIERLEAPIVKDEQIDAAERAQHALMAAIVARQSKLGEQSRHALIEHGAIVADASQLLPTPAGPQVGRLAWASIQPSASWANSVLGHGGVLVIAAHALMRGNALALVEDLNRACGKPHFDLGADKAMRNAAVVVSDLDMIVDADASDAPLGEDVRAGRQGLQRRPIDLVEQMPARYAEPADRAFVIEPVQHRANRCIEFGEAVEDAVAQAPDKPALDHQRRLLDLALSRGRRGRAGRIAVP